MYFSHCRNEFADPSAPLLTLFTVCDNAAHQPGWSPSAWRVGSGLLHVADGFKSNRFRLVWRMAASTRLASNRVEVRAIRVPTIQIMLTDHDRENLLDRTYLRGGHAKAQQRVRKKKGSNQPQLPRNAASLRRSGLRRCDARERGRLPVALNEDDELRRQRGVV
jgi:hypothetical protein